MDSIRLLFLLTVASTTMSVQYSFSSTFTYSGEVRIPAAYSPSRNLQMSYYRSVPHSFAIVNDFGSSPSVPWTFQNYTCGCEHGCEDMACGIIMTFTDYGVSMLQNQQVYVEMQVGGLMQKLVGFLGSENTKIMVAPRIVSKNGSFGGVAITDSFLETNRVLISVYDPQVRPSVVSTTFIRSEWIVSGASIHMTGVSTDCVVKSFQASPTRTLGAVDHDPKYGAMFRFRIVTMPKQYTIVPPALPPYTGGISWMINAPSSNQYAGLWFGAQMNNPTMYHLGVEKGTYNGTVESWGLGNEWLFPAVLAAQPVHGARAPYLRVTDGILDTTNRLIIESTLFGAIAGDNLHDIAIQMRYASITTQIATPIPIVRFQAEHNNYQFYRHLYTSEMIPRTMMANGDTSIEMNGQIYASGSRVLDSGYANFGQGYVMSARIERNEYPD